MSTQPAADPEFVEDVRTGLMDDPKHIPPKWLYDERGSELFERITELDEYYLTDRERSIFRSHADEIVSVCPAETGLVELGAGSAEKTRLLVEALVRRQGSTVYCPIDISRKAAEMAVQRFADDHRVDVQPIVGEFVEGLQKLPSKDAPARLIAFIGSSIGNVPVAEQKRLLQRIRATMRPRDRFLLGTDMVKDLDTMIAAYDDSEGVTAHFSLNLLARMNRELGADFDLEAFAHRVSFDEDKSAIVIHLESLADQTVHVEDLNLTVDFARGERMHIEDSHKYTETMIDELADAADLERVESFYDEDRWFGVHVMAAGTDEEPG